MAKHRRKQTQRALSNPERTKFKNELHSIHSYEDAEERWNQDEFLSIWGDTKQSLRTPYSKPYFHNWEPEFKELAKGRNQLNAKARKPKGKKYYKKTQHESRGAHYKESFSEFDIDYLEALEHAEYRGGYYATCKACGLPQHHGSMHNHDLAICWTCADEINMKEPHFEALF